MFGREAVLSLDLEVLAELAHDVVHDAGVLDVAELAGAHLAAELVDDQRVEIDLAVRLEEVEQLIVDSRRNVDQHELQPLVHLAVDLGQIRLGSPKPGILSPLSARKSPSGLLSEP